MTCDKSSDDAFVLLSTTHLKCKNDMKMPNWGKRQLRTLLHPVVAFAISHQTKTKRGVAKNTFHGVMHEWRFRSVVSSVDVDEDVPFLTQSNYHSFVSCQSFSFMNIQLCDDSKWTNKKFSINFFISWFMAVVAIYSIRHQIRRRNQMVVIFIFMSWSRCWRDQHKAIDDDYANWNYRRRAFGCAYLAEKLFFL